MTLLLISIQILLLIVLIFGSAFFSGAETGLFSLSRARLLEYRENPNTHAKRVIIKLLDNYRNTLATLIMANQFVNVMISILLGRILGHLPLSYSLIMVVSTVISVTVLLLFGEITPKTFALIHAEKFSAKIAVVILFICKILAPFIIIMDKITSIILDLFGRKSTTPLTAEEYYSFLEIAEQAGAFAEKEIVLLKSTLRLREIPVAAVMTSRVGVKVLRTSYSCEEVKKRIRRYKREIFPVVTNDLDDAELVFSPKEFYLMDTAMQENWQDSPCVSRTVFVPRQTSISKALDTLYAHKKVAALTVDEFGRCSGMITLKEIIAELVDEIKTMYTRPESKIVKTSETTWKAGGTLPLHQLREATGVDIPDDLEAFTLNGWFSRCIDQIPRRGDVVETHGLRLTAKKIFHHRLSEVKIELIAPAKSQEHKS